MKKSKKNKKATTDWENEILKKGGKSKEDLIILVIRAFWEEETPTKQWNQGLIWPCSIPLPVRPMFPWPS